MVLVVVSGTEACIVSTFCEYYKSERGAVY